MPTPLSSVAIANGDRAEALAQIQKALAIDPNRAKASRLPRHSPERRSRHVSLGRRSTPQGGFSRRKKRRGSPLRPRLASAEERRYSGGREDEGRHRSRSEERATARATLADLYMQENNTPRQRRQFFARQSKICRTPSTAPACSPLITFVTISSHLESLPTPISGGEASQEHSTQGCLSSAFDFEQGSSEGPSSRRGTCQDRHQRSQGRGSQRHAPSQRRQDTDAFNTLQKAAKANPDSLVVKLWLGRAARAER